MERVLSTLRGFAEAIRDINEKYSHPRIKVTRLVSVTLLMLRLYLLGMLLLLAYKFVTTIAAR